MALNGYVKLHRKLIEWGWYSDCVVKDVFIHLLMVASWKDATYLGHELHAGDAVIGLSKLAQELGFSTQQIRTALNKLESTGEISRKSTNKFTIVTVENWDFYQCDDDESNIPSTNEQQTSNIPSTNEQQTSNIPSTNEQQHLKKVKKVKKVKNNIIRHKHGTYENVLLSDEDFTKLLNEFPLDYQDRIERLSEYMKSTGKGYKDHLATIRNWARRETKPKRRNEVLDILESGVLDD